MDKRPRRTLILVIAVFAALAVTLLLIADRYWIERAEEIPEQPVLSSPEALAPEPSAPALSQEDKSAATEVPADLPKDAPTDSKGPEAPQPVQLVLEGDFVHRYEDEGCTIQIQRVVEGAGQDQLVYFLAEIVLDDPSRLSTAFAKDTFGRNYREKTSEMAARETALLAINGDYYGYRTDGLIIRNGILYRDEGVREGAALLADGSLIVYDETETSAVELLEQGALHSFSFGPILVRDGQPNLDPQSDVKPLNPRTGFGMLAPGHYLLVVVDGRMKGYSKGMKIVDFARLMASYGCQTAYNLDGGGTSTMIFEGQLVNLPQGRDIERSVSDILYIRAPGEEVFIE